MSISATTNKYMSLYLYARPKTTAVANGNSGGSGNTTPTSDGTPSSGTLVQISDAAKSANAALSSTQTQPGNSVKSKVDALYAEVASRGSSVTFDTSKPGELLDVSSLTDDELAQIALNKGGDFLKDLADYASGALATRMWTSLNSFNGAVSNGDIRGQATAIDYLYKEMSPNVRAALGWDQTMMTANDSRLGSERAEYGNIDPTQVIQDLMTAVKNGGLSWNSSEA